MTNLTTEQLAEIRERFPCGDCGGQGFIDATPPGDSRVIPVADCETCHGTGINTEALASSWVKQQRIVEAAGRATELLDRDYSKVSDAFVRGVFQGALEALRAALEGEGE